MEKYKVVNLLRSGVTINLRGFNNKEIPLAPNGFSYITEEELAYIRNTSKIFETGDLKIEGELPKDIEIPESPNALSDDDILKMLKKTQKQIEQDLQNIDNYQVCKRILDIAKEQDKSIKVINLIENRLNELA